MKKATDEYRIKEGNNLFIAGVEKAGKALKSINDRYWRKNIQSYQEYLKAEDTRLQIQNTINKESWD